MAFKLSELLNPAPNSGQASPTRKDDSPPSQRIDAWPAPSSMPPPSYSSIPAPVTTVYEAANALTALASGAPPSTTYAHSNGLAYESRHDQLSSPTSYSDARRMSAYGVAATPLEPSPPTDRTKHSPTLDQYHHGSKSPEEQRRQSMASRSSPPPRLAPIQSLTGALNSKIYEPQQQDHISYGHDASRIVSPPADYNAQNGGDSRMNHVAQHREPDYVRDEPTINQIRQTSAGPDINTHAAALSEDPITRPSEPSPSARIKHEPPTLQEAPSSQATAQHERTNSTADDSIDAETLKAVAELKNEHGLRGASRDASAASPPASTADSIKPMAPTRKRPAPKASAAATKKGVAKKPPAKKRKISPDAQRSTTPGSQTSKKPASKALKNSQSGTPLAGSSPAPPSITAPSPAPSSQPDPDADAASPGASDSNEVFCICRKPDDHTWMIACDGGCEDWYHGRCVNMDEENSKVIDKYICPNCERKGRGVTTWLPMCRMPGCRNPARLKRGGESKYCSDRCGVEFMRMKASGVGMGMDGTVETKPRKAARRKANLTDNIANAPASDDDAPDAADEHDLPGPRGGVLRARELKALATTAHDVAAFRKLGDSVLSPPATASPEKSTFPDSAKLPPTADDAADDDMPATYTLTPAETDRVAAIAARKEELKARRSLLNDRDRFVGLVKEQAAREAEREGVKLKDFCGYDARLAWSEAELDRWRRSREGRMALELGTLEPAVNGAGDDYNGVGREGDYSHVEDGGDVEGARDREEADEMDVDRRTYPPPCAKKRCNLHGGWQKLQQHDVNFEKMELTHEVKSLEREEEQIRMRAALRARKGSSGGGEGSGEGWVQEV